MGGVGPEGEHSICMEHCSSLLKEIVAALDSIGGEGLIRQVLSYGIGRNAARNLMTVLRVDPSEVVGRDPGEAFRDLAGLIRERGGPEIKASPDGDGMIVRISECHFMPWAAEHPLFCRITASFLESLAASLMGGRWCSEEIQTIAHGGDSCVFRLRPRP